MCKRKKAGLRMVPTLIVSGSLFIGSAMKVAGVHPMTPHFSEMGLQPYLTALGCLEIICVALFLFRRTVKFGLLLLTGYLGGAMAAEIPYHMMAAPAVVLLLVWITAFIRMPELFLEAKTTSLTTAKS
jgi:hypothetical protein